MSNIITSTIDIHYPIAGQDNDSQGFRDNYARIQTALAQAKTELERFEAKAVLKTPLTGTGVATNDLAEGVLLNGSYNKFYGSVHTGSNTSGTLSISLWDGTFQKFSLAEDTDITFTHWPATNLYANIRIHLIAASSTQVTVNSITSSGNGTMIQEATFPAVTVNNTNYQVIEAYTYDGGATVFLRYIGRFPIPG